MSLCRYNLDDFYAPIGPRMKLMVGRTTRPILASLVRGLTGLLFLLLVPLLYLVIFWARKKHAQTVGELANTIFG